MVSGQQSVAKGLGGHRSKLTIRSAGKPAGEGKFLKGQVVTKINFSSLVLTSFYVHLVHDSSGV